MTAAQTAFESYRANALMTFLRSPRSAKPSKFILDDEAEIITQHLFQLCNEFSNTADGNAHN